MKPNIRKLKKRRDIPNLIKALNDKWVFIRTSAIEALGEIQAHSAVEPLIQLLNDKTPGIQSYAAEALGKIGDPRALEPLKRALIEIIKDREFKLGRIYYETIIKGQELYKKDIPGRPDQRIALPHHVSVKDYYKGLNSLTKTWLDRKRKAIDQLTELTIEDLVSFLDHSCGYEIDFYIRKKLWSKGGQYRDAVKNDIEKFAISLGLPEEINARLQEEKLMENKVKEKQLYYTNLAAWEYYLKLKAILENE